MLIKTRGILLKTIKYGETSVIAEIYTEERGLRKYTINGVRSKKARIHASLLQVMSLLEMVVYNREDRELNHVKEIRPAHVYQSIPFDIKKSAIALFIAEVIRKTIRESEENKPLFDFIFNTFQYLDTTNQPIVNTHMYFIVELTAFLGFLPAGEYDETTPLFDLQEGTFVSNIPTHRHYLDEQLSQILDHLLHTDLAHCHEVKITAIQRRSLLQNLLDYYKLHMDFMPDIHSHQILHEVLSDS
ncbi:MAG: DNA repair protein RecO [Saprospiraceae bacterium]